ncbi:uncharacterized protein LOC133465447 [Phyllopteryx taeniolatus]|uniref:uncharacterized protein LOC133465447 n=1 Tax=Phyllopteryx taeniolatus TaxID=161469 RepID=UPI002AD3F24E|nr:uncharacterized protein LOC133465447 [Phyllopteryx taeniolatus]
MTTYVVTWARGKTNKTFPAEDKKVDASTAFWMDPLASVSLESKSLVEKKLLSNSVFPPGIHAISTDQAGPGTSLPPAYGFSKNSSPELQKALVVPAAGGIVTSNDKALDLGLNSINSFLKLPWISPNTDATMYPFLDMAYKASFLSQSSPFIYQQLAYQSLCLSGTESSSPEDRLFYVPSYIPACVSSQLEPHFRMHASTPAALTQLHTLQGPLVHQEPSAFSTSFHQEPLSSAFHFDECHLNKSSAKSWLFTSTKTGPSSSNSSACDPVNNSVPASVSVLLPVPTTVDAKKTSKRSTALSAELSGISPINTGSLSSELDSLRQTSGSRHIDSSPEHK